MEGYKKLSSYILATVIQDLTVMFCDIYIRVTSRTRDQMETFLLSRQIEALRQKFIKEGGFRENLFNLRKKEKYKSY